MSAPMLAVHIPSLSNKTVYPQNIRRILHSSNIFGRSPRKKPFISETNPVKRLNFAKEHVNEPDLFWQTVIFSHESKFNLFGLDGKKIVRRKPNTKLQTQNLKHTVKHGGDNVLVWSCMASSGNFWTALGESLRTYTAKCVAEGVYDRDGTYYTFYDGSTVFPVLKVAGAGHSIVEDRTYAISNFSICTTKLYTSGRGALIIRRDSTVSEVNPPINGTYYNPEPISSSLNEFNYLKQISGICSTVEVDRDNRYSRIITLWDDTVKAVKVHISPQFDELAVGVGDIVSITSATWYVIGDIYHICANTASLIEKEDKNHPRYWQLKCIRMERQLAEQEERIQRLESRNQLNSPADFIFSNGAGGKYVINEYVVRGSRRSRAT